MSIASSAVAVDPPQKDGRYWTTETHTDNLGLQHIFQYLSNSGTDNNGILAARAITLAAQLVTDEIATNLAQITQFGSLATVTTNYSTLAQQAPFLRAAYAGMTQEEAVMTGDYLSTFSNAALAAAFNITTGAAATLKTNKLNPAATLAASIRAEAGV